MNKGELVEAVQKLLGEDATKKSADDAVNAVLDAISEGVKDASKLVKGDNDKEVAVQLIGFGTFEVRRRKARNGINPKTKEPIKIPESKTVGFKPSSTLKDSL